MNIMTGNVNFCVVILNACTGDMKNFVFGVDNITDRTCIDSVKGGHCKDLIDFLTLGNMILKICIIWMGNNILIEILKRL